MPDPTEGLTRVEDLPRRKIVRQSRNYAHRAGPQCGRSAYRGPIFTRRLHDLGDLVPGRPREIALTYSQHYCSHCHKYFNADTADLAPPGGHYTYRVIFVAVRLAAEDGQPLRRASWHLWRDHRDFAP